MRFALKFTCSGCGAQMYEPENVDNHNVNCPNMAALAKSNHPFDMKGMSTGVCRICDGTIAEHDTVKLGDGSVIELSK